MKDQNRIDLNGFLNGLRRVLCVFDPMGIAEIPGARVDEKSSLGLLLDEHRSQLHCLIVNQYIRVAGEAGIFDAYLSQPSILFIRYGRGGASPLLFELSL
jgi:hypothetical protein